MVWQRSHHTRRTKVSICKKNRDFRKWKFVRRGCVSATGGGHLKYYINWLGKCSTPQTPSNRSFLTLKFGFFWGVPGGSIFLDFFSNFFQNYQKFNVSRFLLNAWSLWTLRCRRYMHHTWVLSPPLLTVDYAHSTPSLTARVPCPVQLSRSSFDSDTKNNVRPDYSSFFVHSLKSLLCMPPPRYSWHSVMPNRGMYPYLLHLHEEVCPWSSITLRELSILI